MEKLRRESIRLSQIQDIAGCRVVVTDILEQDQFVASLVTDFPGAAVMDRRENPSHGYRAVHVIVEISGKPVEVQVRSSLQHLWAEVSEKSADVLDPTIKYGGGSEGWRNFLTQSSASVATYEGIEKTYSIAVAAKIVLDTAHETFKNGMAGLLGDHIPERVTHDLQRKLEESAREMERRNLEDREMRSNLARLWKDNADLLTFAIKYLDSLEGEVQ